MKLVPELRLTLKQRLLVLQAIFVVGLLCILVACGWLKQNVETRVVFPTFDTELLNGHKETLKWLVDSELQVLQQRIKNAKTRAEQVAIVEAETDPLRFFADGSGYFFTYDMNGTRINVPINKAQNGQNLIDLKDSDGYPFIRAFIDVAKKGGGFVQYRFEKAGQGVQPKLSYAAPIAGTDFFIGAGVYIDDIEKERQAFAKNLSDQTRSYYGYLAGLCLLIFGVSLAASAYFSRSITRVVQKVAQGLRTGAGHVAVASSQLSLTSQSLASGSSEQAASIEETSASLEEASSTTKRNAENVSTAKDLARQTRTAADQAVNDMGSMSQAMDAIKNSSNDIAKIIHAIDEIAFQTNILALNAAVEAARAGEAGMGFAVVADEVRNLAQRSAQAAKETAAKIEGAISRSSQGVAITNKVAQALNEILAKARQMDELAAEIAAASSEQANGIGQINQAVGQMDKVTQSNAANAEEMAASAEELNAQAETMKRLVTDLVDLVGGSQSTDTAAPGTNGASAKSAKLADGVVRRNIPPAAVSAGRDKRPETKRFKF